MNDATLQAFHRFELVGARFSKLIVDETSAIPGQELNVEITRSEPQISKQQYGDRPVIEIKVGVVGKPLLDNDPSLAERVFHVECVAGFVGQDPQDDANLDAFSASMVFYQRNVYWLLRERLDSVFAVTSMRGIYLPWDVSASGFYESPGKGSQTKQRRTKPAKGSATRSKSKKAG